MVIAAINLGILTIVFFVLGMIKPKWPLFFLKNPDRFLIIVITTIMIMVVGTLYGEGHRQHMLEQQKLKAAISDTAAVPEVPEQAPALNQEKQPETQEKAQ